MALTNVDMPDLKLLFERYGVSNNSTIANCSTMFLSYEFQKLLKNLVYGGFKEMPEEKDSLVFDENM